MADETRKILLELDFDTVEAVKRQKELKDLIKATNKEFENTEIGTEEYKKLETVQGLLQNRLKGLKDSTKQANSELTVQKGSVRDLQAQYLQLTKALREAAPGTDVLGLSFDDAKKKAFQLKQEIKDFEAQLGNTAPNVGNYGDAFRDAAGGINVFGMSLKELFNTIVTHPVGLIIAAFTLLAKMLMQNDTIATTLKGVMTGLGIAFDKVSSIVSNAVLAFVEFLNQSEGVGKYLKNGLIRVLNQFIAPVQYIIDLMPAFGEALSGNFSKAVSIAGDATAKFGESILLLNNEVPEFVKNLNSAVVAGRAYEDALDNIEAAQSRLNVKIAELENVRDRLALQANDLRKSEEEREKLRERAISVDKQILNQRLALLDREIKVQEDYVSTLGEGSTKREEAEFRLNDLLVKRLGFLNESLKFEEKQQNKINALIEKEEAAKQKAAEEERKRLEKQQKDAEAFLERSYNGQVKLTQFRLDNAAKVAKDADEKLKAQLKAEDFRVSVLLDNEKLLASEREFILADSAARIEEFNRIHQEALRAEDKKTADEKAAAFQKAESQIVGFLNQTANTAQVISDTRLNNEITALNKRQAQEIKAAGNNKQKIEEINKKYDQQRADAEKKAAQRAAEIAKIQTIINGAQAFVKSLTAAPFPLNLVLAAGTAAATAAQLGKINSEQEKFQYGGLPKRHALGTVIGGMPHSQGGTKFVGSDGTRFEAERGELLAIVNKRDTPLLSMLSNINSIHGKPFFADGGIQPVNDGGFSARFNSQPVVSSVSQTNQILDLFQSLPPSVVFVEDINTGQGRVTQVKSRADI